MVIRKNSDLLAKWMKRHPGAWERAGEEAQLHSRKVQSALAKDQKAFQSVADELDDAELEQLLKDLGDIDPE